MIGIIGIGSMGGAIARGLLSAGTAPSDLLVSSSSVETKAHFVEETGAKLAYSNADLIERAGEGAIVIVAVKPYAIGDVLDDIREVASKRGSVIVSVAAGTPIEFLESHLAPGQPVVRTMPNVAAAVGASVTAYACNTAAAPRADDVAGILASIGIAEQMAEKDFSAFSAIAGCSPAFTFGYIDAMSRAAVKNGLPKATATRIAAQAVYGAAKLLLTKLDDGATAASLADAVQSPGGTTVAGVVELEQAGFGAAVVRGVQASINRDKELLG
jgi:pyrroline-5-carboxylate reductase